MIKSAGNIVHDNLHKVTFVKNLLEYSDNFWQFSYKRNSIWHLYTSHLFANANQNTGYEARRLLTVANNNVNVIISLNRYSFFKELEDKMLVPVNAGTN